MASIFIAQSSTTVVPQKMYWIGCSGTGYVAMDEGRLNAMFEQMPTFQFLLMGHPNMKTKGVKTTADGTQVLEIPEELQVCKSSFLLLVGCIFGSDKLPARGTPDSRLKELLETVLTLGGCESLEQNLKEVYQNPLTPEEDTEGDFTWAMFQTTIYKKDMTDMLAKGYTYTGTRKVENTRRESHIFRAPKGTPPVETEPVEPLEPLEPRNLFG